MSVSALTLDSILATLPHGKSQRLEDVKIYFPDADEEVVETALEVLVDHGFVEKEVFGGVVFYTIKQKELCYE